VAVTLTFGSLFSGIGGFDLGFERGGMQCQWQVEIDTAAVSVLERRFPGVAKYKDVRNVGKDNLKPVDVICGGFPCQDLSIAGKRAGLAGERSGLWHEFIRIIGELSPQWVVIENVPGLLSSNGGADFAVILRGLVERGYGVCWRILDSQYFGVAQRRRRVFIVGSLRDGRAAEVLFEREGSARDTPPSREKGEGIASYTSNGFAGYRDGVGTLRAEGGDYGGGTETLIANCLTAKHGVGRNDPSSETFIAYNIQQNDNGKHKRKDRPNGGMYVNETETALTVGSADPTVIAYNVMPTNSTKDYKAIEAKYSQALTTGGNHGSNQGGTYIAWHENKPLQLQPFGSKIETEGDNDNANATKRRSYQVLPILRKATRAQALQQWGIAKHTSLQSPEILRQDLYGASLRCETDEEEPGLDDGTLSRKKNAGKGNLRDLWKTKRTPRYSPQERGVEEQFTGEFTGAMSGMPYTRTPETKSMQDLRGETQGTRILREAFTNVARRQPTFGVRRLTPTECCRLQGFPDDWNAQGVDSQGNLVDLSDSARYRQLGNAVTVNVLEWIGERIVKA
jgi:DNA (cytosine-5)-methyltransferase 1